MPTKITFTFTCACNMLYYNLHMLLSDEQSDSDSELDDSVVDDHYEPNQSSSSSECSDTLQPQPNQSSSSSSECSDTLPLQPKPTWCVEEEERIDRRMNSHYYVREDEIIRDVLHHGIFVRKCMKSTVGTTQRNRKRNERVYNTYQACKFCGELRRHIPTHLKRHRDIPEVAMAEGNDLAMDLIRREGNDLHNRRVVQEQEGEIVGLGKRPADKLDISQYGPCEICKLWVMFKYLKPHVKKCLKKTNSNETLFSKSLVLQSQILAGHIKSEPSNLMKAEVFRSMKNDDLGNIAKNDRLIVALGESWLRNNISNVEKRRYYASQRMRLVARLLNELNSLNEEEGSQKKPMSHFLEPKHFDAVCLAAIKCCAPFADDEEELASPSNAIKLKYDIKRLVTSNLAFALKSKVDEVRQQSKDFLKLMEIEWLEKVTKLARMVLDRRRYEEHKELPVPDDVEKLTNFLIDQIKTTQRKPDNFFKIVTLVQARLMLYNKRRSGEIEVIKYVLIVFLFIVTVLL